MSKKANPTVIGAFALGAVALVVAGVAIFGSGKFFQHRPRAVAFFQGSIQGLTVGSGVTLRGVEVGSVASIQLQLDLKKMQPVIPVYVEFDTSRFKPIPGETEPTVAELTDQGLLKEAIARGLHARLATQSFVTGQLLVELELDPNEPRHVFGYDPSIVEIPTSESDLEKLKKTLTELPLEEIANRAALVLDDAHRILSSEEIPKILERYADSGKNLDLLLTDARDAVPKLVDEVHTTADSAREVLGQAKSTLNSVQNTLSTADHLLAGEVRDAVRVAIAALVKAEKTLGDADGLIAPNSPQRYDIDQTLRNLTATTRALRVFAEDIERRPNALVVGR